jgi:glutamate racemase
MVAEKYLASLKEKQIDTIVLGCTHYPLLRGVIGEVMSGVTIIDSAVETGKSLRVILDAGPLLRTCSNAGTYKFFVTDSTEKFGAIGGRFLGKNMKDIEKVKIPSLI